MTATIPTTVPSSITAGLNVSFRRFYPDYLYSASWVVTLHAWMGSAKFTIVGSDNGDNYHLFSKLASETTAYVEGNYNYAMVAVNGTSSYQLESGFIKVKPNFQTAVGGLDSRPTLTKTLEALEKAILGIASAEEMEYSIGSKSIKRMDMAQMLVNRGRLKALIKQEENEERINSGLGNNKNVYLRFR